MLPKRYNKRGYRILKMCYTIVWGTLFIPEKEKVCQKLFLQKLWKPIWLRRRYSKSNYQSGMSAY